MGLIGDIIGTIGGAIQNRRNIKATKDINTQNINVAKETYNKTRSDALADRDYANKYNSPAAIMQRLKDAGLNPNLAYGEIGSGTSAIVRGAEAPVPNLTAPRHDLSFMEGKGDGLMDYFDIKAKVAGTNNVNQQTKNLVAQEQGTLLDNLNRLIKNETDAFNLQQLKDTKELILEQMRQSIEGTKANTSATITGTQINLNRDARERLQNAANIKQAAATLVNTYAQTAKTKQEIQNVKIMREALKKDNQLKELDLILKRKGLTYSDPAAIRIITQYLKDHKLDFNYREPDVEAQHIHDSIMQRR